MRFAGGIRSANADMSNDKGGEKPPRQKSKVSYATLIGVGLVGPKARQKCVVDGKWVNIPILHITAMGRRRRLTQLGDGCPSSSV